MDNKFKTDYKLSLDIAKFVAKRFRAESNSEYGLIIVNRQNHLVLFVNNHLLRYLGHQWTDILFEPFSSLLLLDEVQKLELFNYELLNSNPTKLNQKEQSVDIEIALQDVKVMINIQPITIELDEVQYNLFYGVTKSPVTPILNKQQTISILDPWINSAIRLMFTITDNYERFWMFLLGVFVSVLLFNGTMYITQPSVLCKPSLTKTSK